jgi:hypothetical protein
VRRLLAIGLLLTFVAAAAAYSRLPGTREAGVFDVEPPTPYFHYSNGGQPRRRLLVVHGLGGNKDMLNLLGYGLADAGIDVYSIDLPGHGSSSRPFNAVGAEEVVRQVFHRLGPDTNVLGHSLGATLALDLAHEEHIENLVLFSPAPIPVETILSPRILMFQGEADLAPILAFTPELRAKAGAPMEFHEVAGAGHTSAPSDAAVIAQVAAWLGGDTTTLHTSTRQSLLLVMLATSAAFGIVLLQSIPKPVSATKPATLEGKTFIAYIGAAATAATALAFIPVAGWLGLLASDDLMGFVALTGLFLCVFALPAGALRRSFQSLGPVLVAMAAVVYIIAVPLRLVISEYMQLRLTGERQLLFAAMTALALPLFLADELLIRPIRPKWKAVLAMLLTRTLLGAIAFSGALHWGRGSLFLGLMMDSVIYFWIGLWFVGSLVHWRTKDPLATALFMATLQGWLFAALFVTA